MDEKQLKSLIGAIEKLVKKMDGKGDGKSSGRSYDFSSDETSASSSEIKKLADDLAKAKKAQEELDQATQKATENLEKQKKKTEELTSANRERARLHQEQIAHHDTDVEVVKDLQKAINAYGDDIKESNAATAELNKTLEENAKKATAATEEVEKLTDALEEAQQAMYDETVAGLKNEFLSMVGAVKSSETVVGRLAKTFALTSKSGDRFFKSMADKTKQLELGANVAATVFGKMSEALTVGTIDVMQDFESGVRGFQSSTGLLNASISGVTEAGDDLEQLIVKNTIGVRKYGVTIQDTSAALQAFTAEGLLRTGAGQAALADGQLKNIALLNKLGVSAETTTKSFKSLTMSLGMDAADAMTIISDEITALGRATGVGVAEMQSRFAEALPRLSLYGNQAVGIFARVENAATQLGMSSDSILSLGESFQTFEGAAEAAGQLNAVLGGNLLDPIEMMRQSFDDPAAAAMMVRDAFIQQGKSIEQMGSMQIKFVAERIGMDVESARKFLSGQMDKDAVANIQAEANITLEESARETLSVLEATRAQAAEGNMAMLESMGMLGGGMYETARSVATGFAKLNSGFVALGVGVTAFVAQTLLQYKVTIAQHNQELAALNQQTTVLNQIATNTASTARSTAQEAAQAGPQGTGGFFGSKGGKIAGIAGALGAVGIAGMALSSLMSAGDAYAQSQGKIDAARAAKAQAGVSSAVTATSLVPMPAGPTPGPTVPGPAAPAGAKAAARTKQTAQSTSIADMLTAQRDTNAALGGLMTEIKKQGTELTKIAKNTGSTASSLNQ